MWMLLLQYIQKYRKSNAGAWEAEELLLFVDWKAEETPFFL